MPEPIRRQSLTDKVHQHLKAQLACRALKVGDRVNARQIANELNVSRTTANKAIDQLIEEGLVTTDDSRHPVVAALPARLAVHRDPQFEFLNQTDRTYELLLDRLLRGEFGPGEVIKERPLAIEIGVNPATVRRAAEWLRTEGLLERLPRRGWRMTLLSPRDLRDVYGIRMLLEPTAVAGATQRITDERLDDLERQTQRMIELGEHATVFDRREADHYFHKTICEASGNPTLASTLEPLIRKALLVTTVGFRYGRATRSFEEHREILRSLRDRDEKLAVKRIKAHLRNAMKFNAEMSDRQSGSSA
ncbi:MAG TPA: GntR family transcriptional regulator [Lacipirellulaceae bacterium]|nr:GntR family transcriptional regulator [Lacipirellulaceae bacterium]